ncbi:hypothetical protein LTR36_010822 [Oleoguttula mirabilis]|uniref:Uncharacterized protein n=1 Tax=Oleoguttula mirabilis TaxID=1507867 RepID=A0AAV9J466_9PEZI|nr:hypothetical protein LTR36_010822 [Oleoguttula mirabilis]
MSNSLVDKLMLGPRPNGWAPHNKWDPDNLAILIGGSNEDAKNLITELQQRMRTGGKNGTSLLVSSLQQVDPQKTYRTKIWRELEEDEVWASKLDGSAFSEQKHDVFRPEWPEWKKAMKFKLEGKARDRERTETGKTSKPTAGSSAGDTLTIRGSPHPLSHNDRAPPWRHLPAKLLSLSDLTFFVRWGEKIAHIAFTQVKTEGVEDDGLNYLHIRYPLVVAQLQLKLGFDPKLHYLAWRDDGGNWKPIKEEIELQTAIGIMKGSADATEIVFDVHDAPSKRKVGDGDGVDGPSRKRSRR